MTTGKAQARPDEALRQAVAVLRQGGLVAFPTETVYGLGADAANPAAVAQVFAVKGRPPDHPLIVHLASARALDQWACDVPELAHRLAEAFWPGPLTLVLRRHPRVPDVVTGARPTVGLRVPAHPLALQLLEAFEGAVAAPSANRFGAVSPTTAQHVREDLGTQVDCVLDGGPCDVGVESTIVDLSRGEPVVLRPGGIGLEQLEAVVGRPVVWEQARLVAAPGQHPSHYAPRAAVRLVEPVALIGALRELLSAAVSHPEAGQPQRVAVLCAADPLASIQMPPSSSPLPTIDWLPVPTEGAALARVLYERLRQLDRDGYDLAIISSPHDAGLGLAVRDRLQRAAAPRNSTLPGAHHS